MRIFTRLWITVFLAALLFALNTSAQRSPSLQFVFTSDAHYGLTRTTFRGATNVPASVVNAALVSAINTLPTSTFPDDEGLRAGQPIGSIDFLVEGGDASNREEGIGPTAIQPASVSWAQFVSTYIDGLTLTTDHDTRTPFFVIPGNHEASNAIGFHAAMTPPTDPTPMVDIFNRMMQPSTPKTTASFNYARDKVLHSMTLEGIHFVFLQVWPDSIGRAWMEHDLQSVPTEMPVVIFVHDQPDVETKHLKNPNPPFDINATDRFENLLADTFTDGTTIDTPAIDAHTAFETFLTHHPNITAYFHGNSNWNEFYEWTGPHHAAHLHTFRVDSPMKGRDSSKNERMLSFQVATLDTATKRLTVRECLWNQGAAIAWGTSTTVALTATH
jgi:hypothetical protein